MYLIGVGCSTGRIVLGIRLCACLGRKATVIGNLFSQGSNKNCGCCFMPKSPKRIDARSDPAIQVSWGELLDKITILEIKERRLKSLDAVANVRRELALLLR